jgi:hypothetical protein
LRLFEVWRGGGVEGGEDVHHACLALRCGGGGGVGCRCVCAIRGQPTPNSTRGGCYRVSSTTRHHSPSTGMLNNNHRSAYHAIPTAWLMNHPPPLPKNASMLCLFFKVCPPTRLLPDCPLPARHSPSVAAPPAQTRPACRPLAHPAAGCRQAFEDRQRPPRKRRPSICLL